MVARCPETSALGVVTCTTGRAVGSVVPHAEERVGAIATQATTNVFHGVNGLKLLKLGFKPRKVLDSTLALDRNPDFRQILVVDNQGRTAAHTGSNNTDWKGHIEGEAFVAGGNNIIGPEILEAMVKAFEDCEEESLHERLLKAMEAGEEAGGCNQPDHTAALLVVGIEKELKIFSRPTLNLRIDSSEDPTGELRRLYDNYKEFIKERRKNLRNIHGFE